jgi:hypothetical protein
MRKLITLLFVLAISFSLPASAGMRLTLAMVTPEEVSDLSKNENALVKLLFETESEQVLSMDKEWHGIHYILTGDAWSTEGTLGQVILGGQEFGPDLGYGPARLLNKDQVIKISAALNNYSIEKFKSGYNPKAMTKAKIYPEIWGSDEKEDLEYLVSGYQQVVNFYARAAAQGKVVILAII